MLLISIIALASLISALIVFLWHTTTAESSKLQEQARHPQGGGRAQRLRRRQERAAAADAAAQNTYNDNESVQEAGTSNNRRSAKKRAKEARRQAAQVQTTSAQIAEDVSDADDVDELEEQSIAKSAYDIAREQKDGQRTAQEIAEADEIRLANEARKKREKAEFEAWKDLISLDSAGEDAQSQEQLMQRRRDLCDRLKTGKVVELETISTEFGMRCSEVISEIQELEEQGMLTGIMDDRGKYIYFSMDELKQLAQVIQSRGRISIADVAREASAMLKVPVPDAEDGVMAEQALDALIAA